MSGCTAGTPASKPHAITSTSGQTSYTYTYDCNGNLTQRNIGSTYNLTYDAENRLTGVSGAATATFVYDGDGQRVKGTVGGVTTAYIGNYYEYSGGAAKKYYSAGGARVAMNDAGTVRYLLGDHLGSTTITADTAGVRVAELLYKAWGENRYTFSTMPTTLRYTGQRQESGLGGADGLYFYNARWYDPAISRFIQADTIVPGMGNPQSLNRFSYVYNNPLKYTDPSGHCVDNDRQTTRDDLFDCSVEELSALDWAVRSWWLGELAKAGNTKDWFNNIRGIITFFNNTPELHNSSWASLSDAALLWVIQEGFREVKYGEHAVTEGGIKWAEFFGAAEQGQPDDVLESLWGQAEREGTMFGRTYAEGVVGFPGGLEGDVLNAFIGVGNGYRDYLATGSCNGCTFEPLYEHCDWCTSPKNSLAVYIGAEIAARGARELYFAEIGVPSPYSYRNPYAGYLPY